MTEGTFRRLLEEYFDPALSQNDDDSDKECDHRNEGNIIFNLNSSQTLCQYIADLPETTHNETMSKKKLINKINKQIKFQKKFL